MSSDPVNPYETPQPIARPRLQELLHESPLRFRFDLTRQDVSKALSSTGIRPDIRTAKIAVAVIAIPTCLILLLLLLRSIGPRSTFELDGFVFFPAAMFAAMFFSSYLLRRRLISFHSHMMGESSGWLDDQGLWVEQAHQVRYRNLDALVTSAAGKDYWLLAFDETRNQMEILPRRAFDDQGVLGLAIELIDQITPDTKTTTMDLRRLQMPTEDSRFEPGARQTAFSGKLFLGDLKGTRFMNSGKRAVAISWIPVILLLGIGVLWLQTLGEGFRSGWFLTVAVGLPAYVVAKVFLRLYRTKRASRDKETGESVLWCSRGWFDENGVVSMTISGETKTLWTHFQSFEVTDRAIALQSPSGGVWHLFGRDQFDDESWQNAVELVNEKLSR